MSKCTFREINTVIKAANKIYRRNRGKPLSAPELSIRLANELGIDPDTFDLGLQISGEKNSFRPIVDRFGIDTKALLDEFNGDVLAKTNTIKDITSFSINDMFHGIPSALKYFEGRTNRQIALKSWVGEGNSDTYVMDNETVSKNMQHLKNELFVNIQNFLISEGKLDGIDAAKPLFNETFGLVSVDYYNEVMQAATDYFFYGDFTMLNSYTSKKVPNISKDAKITDKVYEIYSDLVFLSNFDTVVKNNFGHMIKINGNYLDSIEGSPVHNKYSIKPDAKSQAYWSNNAHSDEGAQNLNTQIANMLITTIPAYDKLGNKLPIFMETNDMYLLSAVISSFELEHGNKMFSDEGNGFDYMSKNSSRQLEWYLDNIMEVINETSTNPHREVIKEHFQNHYNIIHSLYNFLNDSELNIQAKEQNAETSIKELFGQVLGNSYGAVYHVYNSSGDLSVYQVYSQDFSSTGLQDTVFSTLRTRLNSPKYYDVTNVKNVERFEELFEGVDLEDSMLNTIYNNTNFYEAINNYIRDNIGLRPNRETLIDTLQELRKNEKDRADVKIGTFKSLLNNMMRSVNLDFTSNIAARKGETTDQRELRFNKKVGDLIPNTIKTRLFKVLSKSIISRFPVKSVTNISTLTGEAIPAYKLANLTFKDVDHFDSQRQYEKKKGNRYQNLFLQGDGVIKGTTTKLEIVNDTSEDGDYAPVNKSASKMVAVESLISDFNYGFLESIAPENESDKDRTFNVMIGNYSDKGTILSKLIDGNWTINKKLVRHMDGKEIANIVKSQGNAYYSDALQNVFNDFNALFEAANVPHENLILSEGDNGAGTERSIKEINRILSDPNTDIHDIISRANRPDIKITEELHYSRYGNEFLFNQVLADNYRIFNSQEVEGEENLFDRFVKIQEDSFLNKFEGIKGESNPFKNIESRHLKALNLEGSDFDFSKAVDNGVLNPTVKKWIWMNALARNEYLYMTTKGEYMHPQKNARKRYSDISDVPVKRIEPPKVYKTGDIISNSNVKRVSTEAEAKKVLENIVNDSQYFVITEDQNHYEDIRNRKHYEHLKDGAEKTAIKNSFLYDRVSNFVETSDIDPTNLNVKAALKFGNKVDLLARDFFAGELQPLDTYGLGNPDSLNKFLEDFQTLKQEMIDNGETIIAKDVTLHNPQLGIAGTVDLITYDRNGRIRIYDFKTMKGNNFTERKGNDPNVVYDSTVFGRSKREQHTDQTSLYRIMANNTYGLKVDDLKIIPIALNYNIKKYDSSIPIETVDKDMDSYTLNSIELLPTLDITPRTRIVGEARYGQNRKIAVLNDLGNEGTAFDRGVVERNPDKTYLFAGNDGNTDVVNGLPNAIGINVKKVSINPNSDKTAKPVKVDNKVTYTPTGKTKQTYTITDGKIYNSKGKQVFAGDNADSRKIFANYAVKQNRAIVTNVRGTDYVVNKDLKILSTKSGNFVYANIETGVGKEIADKARPELAKLDVKQVSNIVSQANEYFTNDDFERFKKHVDSRINDAVEAGKEIVVANDFGKAELEKQAPRLYKYLQSRLKRLQEGKIKPLPVMDGTAEFSDAYWNEYLNEVAERLVVMSKRNVTNTSTFEVAIRDSILGTSPTVNIAAMEDFQAGPYSVTGERKYKMTVNSEGKLVPELKQDAHDGYSMMNYVYSRLVDAAYPGKGYNGTKKRFGTLVTDHGVVVKKDSEGVITNQKIRDSLKSEINLRTLQEKMLGIELDGLNLDYKKTYGGEHFIKHLNEFFQISGIELKTNDQGQHMLNLELKIQGENDVWTFHNTSMEVVNLFQIWDALGGEFTTDENGNWTEGSNDMLYDIVTHATHTDEDSTVKKGALKDRIIHIVSNKTSLKAGAANVNSVDAWKQGGRLSYATYESKFMGPQLDASHNIDDSEIREVTQIISALAQNGYTSEMAREAYEDIKNVIAESSQTYLQHLEGLNKINVDTTQKKEKLLDYLANRFMESLDGSKGNDIAQVLMHNLKKDGIQIPFSNQTFYGAFVKDIITRMNTDFISRKYTGIGAVLAASQGIVQLYDVDITKEDGSTFTTQMTQSDVAKIAISEYNPDEFYERHHKYAESNHEIIDDYIFRNMQDKVVLLEDIEIGDRIDVNGDIYDLTTPEQYYDFKNLFSENEVDVVLAENPNLFAVSKLVLPLVKSGDVNTITADLYYNYRQTVDNSLLIGSEEDVNGFINYVSQIAPKSLEARKKGDEVKAVNTESLPFRKVMNVPRDLKPTLHTFRHNGKKRNVFDFQSIKFRYLLENMHDTNFYTKVNPNDLKTMTNLVNYIAKNFGNRTESIELLSVYKNANMYRFVNKFLNNWTQRNFSLLEHNLTTPIVDQNTNFDEYFENDNLMRDILEDVIDNYADSQVTDVEFRAAELMLDDMYKSVFKRSDHETIYEINKKGSKFFSDKLIKDFKSDDTDADIKIITSRSKSPIYVKYVETLPFTDDSVTLSRDRGDGIRENFDNYVRKGEDGEVMYRVPDMRNVVVKRENNSDVIYVRWSNNLTKYGHRVNRDFNKITNTLFKSFGDSLKTVVPLMRDAAEYKTVNRDNEVEILNLNQVTLDLFKKYTGIDYDIALEKGAVFDIASDLTKLMGDKNYASWQKSLEVVASRIPAQSMQSFMPMKNVAYNVGNKNDAYVSISQIWLQGSDFDIDKAYIMGYSFNNKGAYNSWSNLSSYSTKAQLDALNTLPKANNKNLTITRNYNNLDQTMTDYYVELLNVSGRDFKSLTPEAIKVFNKMIRYINKLDVILLSIDPMVESSDFSFEMVADLINKHNNPSKGRDAENALKNKVVSKIQDIISAPSNQMLANSPITIQDWHDVVDAVVARKKAANIGVDQNMNEDTNNSMITTPTSPYDMISYYILQQNASVGKEDVGIAANGVKSFFALTDYYNDFYKNVIKTLGIDSIRKSNQMFHKSFVYRIPGGKDILFSSNTIADLQMNRENVSLIKDNINGKYKPNYSSAALILSGLLSAATDNAKELLMARINATPDLFSMHLYLAVLGLDMEQIVELMTSDIAEEVARLSEHNLFTDKRKNSMGKIFYDLSMKYSKNSLMLNNLKVFKDIYYSSKEFSALAGLLGINQKRKANPWEIYDYLAKIENVFDATNTIMLKHGVGKNPDLTNKKYVEFMKGASSESKSHVEA